MYTRIQSLREFMSLTDTHVYTQHPRIRIGYVWHWLSFTRTHASIMTALYVGIRTNREVVATISYFDRWYAVLTHHPRNRGRDILLWQMIRGDYSSSEKSWPRYLTLTDDTRCLHIFREIVTTISYFDRWYAVITHLPRNRGHDILL